QREGQRDAVQEALADLGYVLPGEPLGQGRQAVLVVGDIVRVRIVDVVVLDQPVDGLVAAEPGEASRDRGGFLRRYGRPGRVPVKPKREDVGRVVRAFAEPLDQVAAGGQLAAVQGLDRGEQALDGLEERRVLEVRVMGGVAGRGVLRVNAADEGQGGPGG